MNDSSKPKLRVRQVEAAEAVPVYNCEVLMRRTAAGVTARVANLEGIEVQADNEREAMQQIVTRFKEAVREHLNAAREIPWIPTAAAKEDEQPRFIGIHL